MQFHLTGYISFIRSSSASAAVHWVGLSSIWPSTVSNCRANFPADKKSVNFSKMGSVSAGHSQSWACSSAESVLRIRWRWTVRSGRSKAAAKRTSSGETPTRWYFPKSRPVKLFGKKWSWPCSHFNSFCNISDANLNLRIIKNKITWNREWFRVHMAVDVVAIWPNISAISHGSHQSIWNR